MNLKRPELFKSGYHLCSLPVPAEIRTLVQEMNWERVDQLFQAQVKPSGAIFQFLQTFHDFDQIEIMISIRDAKNEWEEDGIWHDDGSRVFAFSLSLTEFADSIQGGLLEIQSQATLETVSVPTPEYGTAILFLTGRHGYLHRIRKVEAGTRKILVGWCSKKEV